MRYHLTVVAVLTGLLVTGCSEGVDKEYEARLSYYESCIASMTQEHIKNPTGDGLNSFEWATNVCKQYKP